MNFVSYAQNFEDVMLRRALKDVAQGFYIDVGANDPVVDSVTQAFYERGWSGINIEPMRQYHARLSHARPRDTNLPVAVGDSSGHISFFLVPDTGLSTTDAAIAKQHAAAGLNVVEENVEVVTLAQVCERHVKGPIHFLKVDVEGHEAAVLRGMDFNRWRPWLLLVEATQPQSQVASHGEWEPMVLAAGYQRVYFDGLNHFYVAHEHQELLPAFEVPPNFFDHFRLRPGHHYTDPSGWPSVPASPDGKDSVPALSANGRFDAYLPFLQPLPHMHPGAALLDLGCACAGWLALMRELGMPAQGVSTDENRLGTCRDRGVNVLHGDPLARIRQAPDGSLAVVSAMNLADDWVVGIADVVREARRALRPGGLLILEAPNPGALGIAACLPPGHGFARTTMLRLHEAPLPDISHEVGLIEVLARTSADQAIVAQKGGFDAAAAPSAAAALDAAFRQVPGSNLNELAARYDRQWSTRLRDMHLIGEMARESSITLQRGHKELKARLDAIERAQAISAGLERGAVNQVFALNSEVSALNAHVQAMRQSTSWRVTAPLRWAGALPRMLRQHGAAGTARSALRHGSLSFARGAVRALQNRPKARAAILRMAKVLGLEPYLQRLRTVPPPPVVAQDPGLMSASARRVHQHLKSAIASRAENKEEPVADRH